MKHKMFAFLVVFSLAVATASAANGPSVASLKGKYSFQYGASHFNYISNSTTCFGSQFTQWFNSDKMEVIDGEATFDGAGNVSITAMDYGHFNQAASNDTLQPTCTSNGNGGGSVTWTTGSAIYDPPSAVTATGTYVVHSDGTGSMTLNVSGGDNPTLILRIANGTKPATTVFLHGLRASDNSVDGMGSAVLE
jgi:hypothetical protein